MENLLSDYGIPPRFQDKSFDNFVPQNEDQKKKLDIIKNSKDGLLLLGSYGTGKTHLAVALLKERIKQGKHSNWRDGFFITSSELCQLISDNLAHRRTSEEWDNPKPVWEKIIETDFLVLDDLGTEQMTETRGDKLYYLINDRYLNNRITILTSNRSLDELGELIDEKIVSRILEMAKVIEIRGEDYRQKLARSGE